MSLKNNKGITLAVLVLTLVILIIIAGISFNEVVDSGVITKTDNAVNYYNNRVNTIYQYEENAITHNIVNFQVKN